MLTRLIANSPKSTYFEAKEDHEFKRTVYSGDRSLPWNRSGRPSSRSCANGWRRPKASLPDFINGWASPAASELAAGFPDTQPIILQANLENPEAVKRLFKESIDGLGKLDSIVLNAGVFIPHPVSLEIDQWWEIWKKIMKIT